MFLAPLFSLALQSTVVVTTPPAPAAKPERPVCHYIDTTGSRMGGTRVCRSRAEWRALEQPLDAAAISNSLNSGGFNAGPDGSDAPTIRR